MRTPWWLVDIGMYTSSDILMEFITSVRPRKAILTHCCFLEICIVSPVCTYERQIHIRYWHVAQLDRAQRYGRWCCRFDSCRVSFPIYLSWQRVITARITLDESRWFESNCRNFVFLIKHLGYKTQCHESERHSSHIWQIREVHLTDTFFVLLFIMKWFIMDKRKILK